MTALFYPYANPQARASIKSRPEDFIVYEELGFEPSGEGEHLMLQIEKTGLGTAELVTRIARAYDIKPAAIGYSGLKDKQAVTTQWFSLYLPGKDRDREPPTADEFRVLRAARHHRKLRRGSHRGNRFSVILREVENFNAAAPMQLEKLGAEGMANYFGQQRFGRGGDNVEQALSKIGSKRLKRQQRSILLSSLRSFLFNQILSRRIADGIWRQPLDGDVFMLQGSHSIFSESLDDDLLRRYRSFDISSCASLYGSGQSMLGGQARAIEEEIFAAHAPLTDCLDQQGVKRQMRALRVQPLDFEYDFDAGEACLKLQVELPAGCYLTSLLAHFAEISDASQGDFR